MNLITLALVLASSFKCKANVITTLKTPKIDLINVLKNNLQANNDDYSESTSKTTTTPITTNPTINSIYLDTNKIKENSAKFGYRKGTAIVDSKDGNDTIAVGDARGNKRRSFNVLGSENLEENVSTHHDYESLSIQVPNQPVVTTVKRTFKDLPTKEATVTEKVKPKALGNATFRSLGEYQKIEKFKKFMENNADLFNEFLKKKKQDLQKEKQRSEATTIKLKIPTLDALRMRVPTAAPNKWTIAELLDMAPARGERIHELRLKNRLCQRHVLIPEGPKYDSKGVSYMGVYRHAGRRDYMLTPRPKLVLPKCCNCCKKSVLGCE